MHLYSLLLEQNYSKGIVPYHCEFYELKKKVQGSISDPHNHNTVVSL